MKHNAHIYTTLIYYIKMYNFYEMLMDRYSQQPDILRVHLKRLTIYYRMRDILDEVG